LNIKADFIISAASARDFPDDGVPELAFVGRSNVGKSSLINALTRTRIARTSAAPGKTRLANVYRADRGAGPLYLVDLPGFGYARGGQPAAQEFAELTRAYFGQASRAGQAGRLPRQTPSAILLVDSRHPGLESDVAAWEWLQDTVAERCAIAATKTDKLARGERIRAMRQFESVFETSVLPVSAVTGEGLDELWKLIDRLANRRSSNRTRRSSQPPPHEETARPRPRPNPAAAAKNTRR